MNFATDTGFSGGSNVPAQSPVSPEEIAPHFPQLEILECLGRGGMGVVYKARQKALNRLVALKLLAPEREKDAQFAERFAREAQALAALSHSHIVTIHDFGRTNGFFYLLMEFVDGVNLRQLLQARKLTPEEALAIVPPLCEALQFAHERGIVHRDIKPENLLLDRAGRIKIADFGIARMLGTNPVDEQAAGTPGYMAPEQKETPQRVDSRADIYSLGVVFYEMLTGELPADKLQPPSRKVQIDVRLDGIVLRALEKSPELRFQTATEMRTQVEAVVNEVVPGLSDPAAPGTIPPSTGMAPRFDQAANPWMRLVSWRSAALLGLPMLLLLFGLLYLMRSNPNPATGQASSATIKMVPKSSGPVVAENDPSGLMASSKAGLTTARGDFDPVIERKLVNNANENSSAFLDLETGGVQTNDSLVIGGEALRRWLLQTGMDVEFPGHSDANGAWLRGWNMTVVEVADTMWDTATAQTIFGDARLAAEVKRRASSQREDITSIAIEDGKARTWLFRTREGSIGVLQLIDTADFPRSARLRYKLVTRSTVATMTNAARPAFGPAIERVLPTGAPCRQQYFGFRSGEVFVVGNGPGTTSEEYAKDWKKGEDAGGFDFTVECGDSGNLRIVGQGCVFTRDKADLTWDTATPEEAIAGMKRASFINGVVELTAADLPVAYLFKTSRNELGLLEVLGVVEDERGYHGAGKKGHGMRFRYKLVQGGEPQLVSSAPTVTIFTAAGGLAPEEVATLVSSPIEMAMRGAGGVKGLRSVSSVGLSTVFVEFDAGQDINVARQIITERLQQVLAQLPQDAKPVLTPMSSNMDEAMGTEWTLKNPFVDRTKAYIDLDAGMIIPAPAELALTDRKAVWDWAEREGVDAVADTSEQVRGLLGFGLHVASVPDAEWQQGTFESIARAVLAAELSVQKHPLPDTMAQSSVSANTTSTAPQQSRTFAFRTRDNNFGLLHLVTTTDEPGGSVTFRCKLMPSNTPHAPAVSTPQ